MAQPSFRSRILGRIPRVADIVSFRLERPAGYDYRAGQWFVITLSGPDGPRTHHFSHSNAPLEPVLEFTTRLRGTEFKNALDGLPLGAEVELEGPYGAFTLPDDPQDVAFIAGGIGITCVRSILLWLADPRTPPSARPRSVALLYANRSESSIPFGEELACLAAVIPGLRVTHVISQPGTDWKGYRGHIHRGILQRELLDPERWTYLVSGPPAFVQSIRDELLAWDARNASIKMERFEGY